MGVLHQSRTGLQADIRLRPRSLQCLPRAGDRNHSRKPTGSYRAVVGYHGECSTFFNPVRETAANQAIGIVLASSYQQSYALPLVCLAPYARSAALRHETRSSQRFANAAKINDFSSKDLYFPDPDRTRSIFSAFINFIKFSEQSETFINRLRDQSTAVIKERQAVTEETSELEHRMAQFK